MKARTRLKLHVSMASALLLGATTTPVLAQNSDTIFQSTWEECDGTLQSAVYDTPSSWLAATGFSWPLPYGNAFALDIPTGRVISMRFTAGGGVSGSIELAERASLPSGAATMSISRCPGDLRSSELNSATARCLAYNGTSQPLLLWRNGSGSAGVCPLTAGQTYFLNIAYYAVPYRSGDQTTCDDSSCGTWVLSRLF